MKVYPFFEIVKHKEIKTSVLYINRPTSRNAMNWEFFRDLPFQIQELERDPETAVVIIAGKGKSFSVGLDLREFVYDFGNIVFSENASEREELYRLIREMQRGFLELYRSSFVSIACIHKHCYGAALDLVSFCDLRIASSDAVFSIREAEFGITADLGVLQILPSIIGKGATAKLAYTATDVHADEAFRIGLIEEVHNDEEAALKRSLELAGEIAKHPPLGVKGIRQSLNAPFDPDREMERAALWTAAFLDSPEFRDIARKHFHYDNPDRSD